MKKTKYVSAKNVKTTSIYPWSEDPSDILTTNKATSFSSDKIEAINLQTGELIGETRMITTKKIDSESFVKIFGPGIETMKELSHGALELLIYIIGILCKTNTTKSDKNEMYLNYSILIGDEGYNRANTTYTSAINELCIADILRPKEKCKNLFFFHHRIIFKGCRLKFLSKK